MSKFTDAELMDALGTILSPRPLVPDQVTLDRLHATINTLNLEPVVLARRWPRVLTGFRRRIANHTSLLIITTASLLLTGGVAAAAVITDKLPGPTRAIAYDLGLPVTSPALFNARQNLEQLKTFVSGHDAKQARKSSQARKLARQLAQDMKGLDHGDLAQIQDSADGVLSEVGVVPPSVTTTIPTTTTVAGSESQGQDSISTIPTSSSTGESSSAESSSTTTTTLSGDAVPTQSLSPQSPSDTVPSDSNSGN